jgi:hypothetical protein
MINQPHSSLICAGKLFSDYIFIFESIYLLQFLGLVVCLVGVKGAR